MGECFITRRGDSNRIPTLDNSYPEDITVVSGDVARFSVVFADSNSSTSHTYRWYVNGEIVNGVSGPTYSRDTSSDKGEFTVYCEISNNAGSVQTRSAILTVHKAPVLNASLPSDVSTDVTGAATFTATVIDAGYPTDISYQWYVNNVPIDGATNPSYTVISAEKGSTLIYCKISNGAMSVNSRVATLIAEKLWLINNGIDHYNITGGWSGSDDSGFINGILTTHGEVVSSIKMIDMTKYSLLIGTKSDYYDNGEQYGSGAAIGISSSNTGVDYIANVSGKNDTILKLNISSVEGYYYIKMHSYLARLSISDLRLE